MEYFRELSRVISGVEVTGQKAGKIAAGRAADLLVNTILEAAKSGKKIMLIGNGGSASISSHISIDLLKNAGIASICFNDPSLLTCLSNDLGYEQVFRKPVSMLARRGDILIAISSSGKSSNILLASDEAKRKGCFLVTLSGFKGNNPLRKKGNINFYVASDSYGYVEIAHLAICHMLVDKIMQDNG